MKRKILNNKLFIFLLIIFILVGIMSIIPLTKYDKDQKNLIKEHIKLIDDCKNLDEINSTYNQILFCKDILKNDFSEYAINTKDAYDNYIVDFLRTYFNEFISILIIVIGSTYYITKYLKNRIILNDITRQKYTTIIKKLFFSSWRYSLLLPIMMAIIFFIICLFVKSQNISNIIIDQKTILYFGALCFQAFILSLIYTNISLLISRKEHNFLLAIVKSYILLIVIELFFESVLIKVIAKFFKSDNGYYFNIINIYNFLNTDNIFISLFIQLFVLILSFIVLLLFYKNKEKLIIDCENEN